MKKLIFSISIFFIFYTYSFSLVKVYSTGDRSEKKIALTFDDGPNNTSLLKVLDLLKSENIKASFFLIGKDIPLRKIEVERIYDEGHLVLNHSYTHANLKNTSREKILFEISETNNVIKEIIGVEPILYRPPYGIITEDIKEVVRDLEMSIVLWNVDGEDWNTKRKVEDVIKIQKNQTKNGSIILMHTQAYKNTSYEVLKELIPYYKNEEFQFVTLEELLNIKAYREYKENQNKEIALEH